MATPGGQQLIPIFPAPPRPPDGSWTPGYGNELNRWLTNVVNILAGFTYGRFGGMMVATTFPQTDSGLYPGEVFIHNGVLTVSALDTVYLEGVSVTGSVGTLTVTP